MLTALRSKGSNTFVWIIIGLLIVGLAGFGIDTSGGQATTPVASVGDEDITINDYARAVNNQNREASQRVGRQLTMSEMRLLGLDRLVLDGLISDATLSNEARRVGISVGDENVRKGLMSTPAFQGLDGQFSPETYEFTLENAGLEPSEYETIVRKDATRNILRASVAGGVRAPEVGALALVGYQSEERALDWVRLDRSHLADPITSPSEEDLTQHYEANAATYTLPETREVTVAYVTDAMLMDSVAVDEADLLAIYEERSADYQSPPRRILDRIVFPDLAAAEAGKTALDAGEQSFDDLAAARGLSFEDIDLGEVAATDLNRAERDILFADITAGTFGPIQSDLGPALYRVNAVLEATSIPFDDARPDLFEEIAQEEAEAMIADAVQNIQVLIAGGASIEDVAAESILTLETLTLTPDTTDGIAADAALREEAFVAGLGEDRDLLDLSDGIFVLRVDSIQEQTLQPLDDVRGAVETSWRTEEATKRVVALAESLKARIDDGGELGEIAAEFDLIVTAEAPLRRDGIIEDTPPAFVAAVFETQPGKGAVAEDGDTVLLARITDIIAADPTDESLGGMVANVRNQLTQTTSADVMFYFNRGLQENAGVSVDQALLEQILSQLGASGG